VLQLNKVKTAFAEDEQVDFVPLALPVSKLEVAPGVEWSPVGQQLPDVRKALPLMGELRLTDDVPALAAFTHGTLSSPRWSPVACAILPHGDGFW